MWQQVIVFLIVAAAALHAAGKYLPLTWRRRIVDMLARCGIPQKLLTACFKTAPGCADGCSSCGSCDSEAAPPAGASSARRVIKLHVRQ